MNRKGILAALLSAVMLFSVRTTSAAIDQGQNKDELIAKVHEYVHSWWQPLLVKGQMDFNISSEWWPKMLEDDGWGVKTVANLAYDMNEYYKRQGLSDLEGIESANNNDRDANRARVQTAVDDLQNKVSFSLSTDGVNCDATSFDLCHRYMTTIGEFIARDTWLPKGGEAHIALVLSPTAKDVSVSINPDGKHFSITAPSSVEVGEWDTKMLNGLKRGGRDVL